MPEREHADKRAADSGLPGRGATAESPRTLAALATRLQRTAGNAATTAVLARSLDVDVPASRIGIGRDPLDDRSLRHERHDGTLWVRGLGEGEHGVADNDVIQGMVGDCFFLSPLMCLARINPRRIRRMIRGPFGLTSAGAQVYEVDLYTRTGSGRAVTRTFRLDDRFVTATNGDPRYAQHGDMSALGPELWVMLMEKGWAALRGGYDQINFGNAQDGIFALTGTSSTWHNVASTSDDDILEDMHDAIVDGKPVVVNTKQTLTPEQRQRARDLGKRVTPAHSYNVSWANTVRRNLMIRNPHGNNHLEDLSMADFNTFFEWYLIGDESLR